MSNDTILADRVGIDPGLTGAVAFYTEQGDIELYDMPTKQKPWELKKRMVDAKGLYELIYHRVDELTKFTIEVVRAMPKQGVTSVFTFGGAFYTAISVVDIFGCKLHYVTPQVWKRQIGLIGCAKDDSRLAALKMFPQLALALKRKKDVDRAEALLIALYEEE